MAYISSNAKICSMNKKIEAYLNLKNKWKLYELVLLHGCTILSEDMYKEFLANGVIYIE